MKRGRGEGEGELKIEWVARANHSGDGKAVGDMEAFVFSSFKVPALKLLGYLLLSSCFFGSFCFTCF